jgi:hypothetical protein
MLIQTGRRRRIINVDRVLGLNNLCGGGGGI